MITAILILIAFVLFILGFVLLKKQTIFLTLLSDDRPENKRFLQVYGLIFSGLGIVSLTLIPIANTVVVLYFLAVMMLASGSFSFQFSKKMN